MGVDIGNKEYNRDVVVSWDSRVAFEWCFQSAGGGVHRDIVTPRVTAAARRGVAAPECTRKMFTAPVELERYATEAAAGAKGRLQEHLGYSDLAEALSAYQTYICMYCKSISKCHIQTKCDFDHLVQDPGKAAHSRRRTLAI